MDRNVETVNAFYNRKFAEVNRRFRVLRDRYGDGKTIRQLASKEEVDDLLNVVLELRNLLRNLQWYGEVNRRGFVKILKKKDKKIATGKVQEQYLRTKVDPRPFASNIQITRDMNTVNSWLSDLGEMQPTDDSSETESSASFSRGTHTPTNVPKHLSDEIERSIKDDNVPALEIALKSLWQIHSMDSSSGQRFLLGLLQRAISSCSSNATIAILDKLVTLEEEDDLNQRNCIHRLIISASRTPGQVTDTGDDPFLNTEKADIIVPAEAPNLRQHAGSTFRSRNGLPTSHNQDQNQSLQLLTNNLNPHQRKAIIARDSYGRIPLHYAAQFGFKTMCQTLRMAMSKWDLIDTSADINSPQWQDEEGNTPLRLSVLNGHVRTTEFLLNIQCPDASLTAKTILTSQESCTLLKIAAKRDFAEIIRLLLQAGADPNACDNEGEVVLHEVARQGHLASARALVEASDTRSLNLDVREDVYGWTPLHVASVNNQYPLVQILADSGSNVKLTDASDWTAKEHAALRGFLDIARYLEIRCSEDDQAQGTQRTPDENSTGSTLNGKSTTSIPRQNGTAYYSDFIKSFGHRYLKDESLILVSLGSMDQRKDFKPVSLDNIPLKRAHATQLDTALSLIVSAKGATSHELAILDLPVNESVTTDPIVFTAKDVTSVKLLFDIIPTYAGLKEEVVGRGVALLSSIKPTIGSKRMNLQGDMSVPILASKSMDFIGTVNFNFLVITPFTHPNMSINENQTYWKSVSGPMVIGHRGMGKNMASRRSLQLGENTIQSFIAAANLGASYVEFDVQLTKDHVPVIYHDFLVSETGIDAPVHTLTLEQFLHVNSTRSSYSQQTSRSAENGESHTNGTSSDPTTKPRERARSLGASDMASMPDMSERMKHTRDFKLKGYKANSRNFIQEPFTTLEEMLRKLPPHIGFNIEMKYPMLFESEEQEMDTYAVELNSFVDTVLTMVYDHGKGRDILFSSFHPDICLLLSFKQPSIPILFLTDAGSAPVGDVRASSLKEAIRFASRWNLLGIVSAAEPFVSCPRLVRVVKESGLVCVSYGTLNNDPACVKAQVDEGIDAVIVDSVLAIRQDLTRSSAEKPSTAVAVN